jgi:formiminoglutamase
VITLGLTMHALWLTPPDKPENDLPAYSLGKHLRPRSRKISVALIGLDATLAQKTREHLYAMSWDFGKLPLRDLGDLRKTNVEFGIPLLRELHSSGIIPVLLGASDHLFRAQYLAFGELNRQVNLLQVDRRIALSAAKGDEEVLDAAVYRKGAKKSFHLLHLGAQRHLVDPAILTQMAATSQEYVRLGAAKAAPEELEPLIRDADLAGINIGAINHLEAPARSGFTPSGFSLHEASQLAYYAGNSDKLSSFGIYGFDSSNKSTVEIELTASAYAQMVWYFLSGVARRQGDFPVTVKGLMEYVVDLPEYHRLTFWRSPKSNRWWVQVPAKKFQGEERHRLIACSYSDYQKATNDHFLSDRLLMAFKRHS